MLDALALPGAVVLPLGQHLSILRMTEDLLVGEPKLGGFWRAPAALLPLLLASSGRGAVAYVEAEFFGGMGMQTAQVWASGESVFGPVHMADGDSTPVSPISLALRWLGVSCGEGDYDEFDAVGLGGWGS
ncbi:hypothetical protein [Actinokineospora inagensis]|uniref:hypothetical protein n=1 Tax=Actinokineospora inagensis TaxID=103730 RepID=UPI001FE194AC|nr:hypothetical protein [Actinokineospora inagensis]